MPLSRDHIFFGFGPKMTNEQWNYVDSMIDNRLTIVDAAAGTSKTTMAVATAKYLQRPLIYLVAPVQEKSLGYLPGEKDDKIGPYAQPLKDALIKLNEKPMQAIYSERLGNKSGSAWVEVDAHTFKRGTNIEDSFVIIDEAQNYTLHDLKKVLTRIHDSNRVALIGHSGQCDLPDPRQSGFIPYIEYLRTKSYVHVAQLTRNFRGELARDADGIDEWLAAQQK